MKVCAEKASKTGWEIIEKYKANGDFAWWQVTDLFALFLWITYIKCFGII